MKRTSKILAGAALVLGASASLALPAAGSRGDDELPLRLRANGGHPTRGETSIVDLTVSSWTSTEEHESIIRALSAGDLPVRANTVFRDALQASDSNGRIAFQGELGIDIRYAYEIEKNGGRTIFLAADRPIDADEAMEAGRLSLDYNVTIAVIELDEHGSGAGSLWAAASVAMGPDGLLEPTGVDVQPIHLGQVRILN